MPWFWQSKTRSETSADSQTSSTTTTTSSSSAKPGDHLHISKNSTKADASPILSALKTPETLVSTFILTSVALVSIRFYQRNLRRIPSTHYLRPSNFPPQRSTSSSAEVQNLPGPSLFGKVTSIGDPDNFRFYHTPGGRLLLWSTFIRPIPSTKQALKDQTLHIRLAGIDAPELGHFGKPPQPYGAESLEYLKSIIEGRYVRIYPLRRDQYERVVALAFISRGWLRGLAENWWEEWPWIWRKDVGLNVIRAGMATVYEASYGSEFGGKNREKRYIQAEKQAKEHRRGMWSGKPSKSDVTTKSQDHGFWSNLFSWLGWKSNQQPVGTVETPREYKNRHQKLEKGKETADKAKKLHGY